MRGRSNGLWPARASGTYHLRFFLTSGRGVTSTGTGRRDRLSGSPVGLVPRQPHPPTFTQAVHV